MQIDLIAGARPNFMKIAPIIEAIENGKNQGKDIDYRLVHSGQFYDNKSAGTDIPEPDLKNLFQMLTAGTTK